MLILNARETASALPRRALVDALKNAFREGCEAPLRHRHSIKIPNEADASLLIMPAWQGGKYLGIKNVLVVPENHRRGKPAVAASYFLYSALSGELLSVIDGKELTNRRTAAASALASSYLSRRDSSHLLMIGAGGLVPHLIRAHCDVRSINKVSIWARDIKKSRSLANSMTLNGVQINAIEALDIGCSQADIISSATLSEAPLVLAKNVAAGTHVDLVGAFMPSMRESDDELIRTSTLFADTVEGALIEGGDYVQPLEAGIISAADIVADLHSLSMRHHIGRRSDQEITVFKSTGTALEDLAAGILAFETSSAA
ncbi:MAG: ornithine cyclodeaminase [Arenicella sp.]|jgi:ornithine cyclodeaminase